MHIMIFLGNTESGLPTTESMSTLRLSEDGCTKSIMMPGTKGQAEEGSMIIGKRLWRKKMH